jgi:hypothetical protein
MRRLILSLSVLSLLLALTVSCKNEGAGDTKKIEDLIASGESPVEVGSVFRVMNPAMPMFQVSLKNVSDKPVAAVKWTAVYRDKDGALLADARAEGGYGDALNLIKPGQGVSGTFRAGSESAVSAKLVIRDVVYMKQNPLGEKFGHLPYKWENPNYQAALDAALAQ